MNFNVSQKIFFNQDNRTIWAKVSSKNALELYHPFCLKNGVIIPTKKDELIYLNGLTYIREFTRWEPLKGFELTIGTKNGKKSKVIWEIKSLGQGCEVKITVFPYRTNKIATFLQPFVNFFIVKPRLKKYLQSVLRGLQFHLDRQIKVEKNQFGHHPWFS